MFKRMTTSQKRGAVLLLVIVVAIAGWQWRVSQLAKQQKLPDLPEKEQQEWGKSVDTGNKGPTGLRSAPTQVQIELNGADTTELMTVKGIGPTFARRIVKYRKLIGGFQSKEELLKVYGIDEERYAGIAPQVYVVPLPGSDTASVDDKGQEEFETEEASIPPKEEFANASPSEPKFTPKVRPELASVDLNTADSTQLVTVPGIGGKTARTLIKYRKRIFFFHSLDQLAEVWGIRPENLERMKPYLRIGPTGAFPHLQVNAHSQEELARHGYLSPKQAGLIIAYRDQHGDFSSVEDLKQIRAIDHALWEKLGPYLLF